MAGGAIDRLMARLLRRRLAAPWAMMISTATMGLVLLVTADSVLLDGYACR
jgi:hypothetical protein